MYGIKEQTTNEYIIQKSRFIAILYPLSAREDIVLKLNEAKKEYPDATHYCYAYICDSEKRANDDGEPSGTAGNPILNILEGKELNNILCIVIRYFGGIKLGAPGLIRAYGKATKLAIEKAEIGKYHSAFIVESTFSYAQEKHINYLLKDATIIKRKFQEYITYQYLILEEDWEQIKNNICHISLSTEIVQSTYQIR